LVIGMQPHPIHAEGTSFVQPNEALGTFKQAFPVAQKGQDPFPPNGSRIVAGVAIAKARCALTANGGLTRGRSAFSR